MEVHPEYPRLRGERDDGASEDIDKPLPLRALLTRPVVVSVANYGVMGLLEILSGSLIPLVWSTSVEFGGLSMSPASIGLWMAGYGFLNGILQFVAFPPIVGRFGPRRVFIASVLCFFPIYILLPIENLAIHHSSRGINPAAALLIVLQLSALSFAHMGFSKFLSTMCYIQPLKYFHNDKLRYSCTYPLLPPTSGLLGLQMELRR
jgi:hypothetical protein